MDNRRVKPNLEEETGSSFIPLASERMRNTVHNSGSMSTTNSNEGNIKLNKFTCNSTRNAS
jgi:hypothetical protein